MRSVVLILSQYNFYLNLSILFYLNLTSHNKHHLHLNLVGDISGSTKNQVLIYLNYIFPNYTISGLKGQQY